jgi:hypothetical protein
MASARLLQGCIACRRSAAAYTALLGLRSDEGAPGFLRLSGASVAAVLCKSCGLLGCWHAAETTVVALAAAAATT